MVFAFFLGRVSGPLVEGVELFNDCSKPISNLGLCLFFFSLWLFRSLLRGELGF